MRKRLSGREIPFSGLTKKKKELLKTDQEDHRFCSKCQISIKSQLNIFYMNARTLKEMHQP